MTLPPNDKIPLYGMPKSGTCWVKKKEIKIVEGKSS
jgi:hypothetical protein